MLKSMYLFLHNLIITLISICLIFVFTLYYPRLIHIIYDEFFDSEVFSISSIQGSIANGFIFNNIKYKDSLSIEQVELKYDIFDMLFLERKIDKIEILKPIIDKKLYSSKSDSKSSSTFYIPKFIISHILLKDALIKDSIDYKLSFDLSDLVYENALVMVENINDLDLHVGSKTDVNVSIKAKKLRFDKDLHVKQINAEVDVASNHIKIKGDIKNNTLQGNALLKYNKALVENIQDTFKEIPKSLNINIISADFSSIALDTNIDTLKLKDKNISINSIDINASYAYTDDFIDLHVSHDINETKNSVNALHRAVVGFDGSLKDDLHVSIKKSDFTLPFDDINASLDVNSSNLSLNIETNCSKSTILSDDFNIFRLRNTIDKLNLNFLPNLPLSLKKYPISADIDSSYMLSENFFDGYINIKTIHTTYSGNFIFDTEHFNTDGFIETDANTEFWKSIPIKNIDKIHLISDYSVENSMLYINSQELHVTLFDKNKKINGWGSFSTSKFDFKGNYDENRTLLYLNSNIPSLYSVIDSFYELKLPKDSKFDCELDMNATIVIDDSLHVSNNIHLPWYLAMTDKDNIIYGTDANISMSIKNDYLLIDKYSFEFFNRDFFATKPSRIYLDKNDVKIDEFWINDAIILNGEYKLDTNKLDINANSNSYHYKDKDIDTDLDLHVNIQKDDNLTSVEGKIDLKNTLITYKPVSSNIVSDDDIILIQDVKTPQKIPLFLNVQITSSEPIHYKTKEIDVSLTPDITIYKEALKEIEILGWIVTDTGYVYNGGVEYEIKKSEVYFGGGAINPYLNLHLYYEIDLNEIDIYVTNTLTSPVLLFTSNPPMSQSDIISYLLFGTPANNSFDSDSTNTNGINAANIVLGTGLKQMIGDTTGLRVDTLNLLSKEDGGIGFEVGTRVSNDIRIILKNDDIFSMILQMNLSKNLRLDVDVQETGQGINIIYVKDYEDILKK